MPASGAHVLVGGNRPEGPIDSIGNRAHRIQGGGHPQGGSGSRRVELDHRIRLDDLGEVTDPVVLRLIRGTPDQGEPKEHSDEKSTAH